MATPIKSNEFVAVSGGASDPEIKAGTVDPSAGGGVTAPEGSIFLRFQAGTGEAWLKSSTGNTDWTQIISGSGGATTLDEAYDGGASGVGRTITADAGAVQINATTVDTQEGLFIDRAPGGSSAAVGLRVDMGVGGNASARSIIVNDSGAGSSIEVAKSGSGFAVDLQLSAVAAQGLRVDSSVASTASAISVTRNVTGATGEMLTLSKFPAALTAGDGMSISMGPNTSGDALQLSSTGTGTALRTTDGNVVMGTIGTPLSAGKLTVGDNSNAGITVRNNASTAEVELYVDGTAATLGTNSTHPLSLYTDGTTRFTIDTSGNMNAGDNLQIISTSIFDFATEHGTPGVNGNYLAGGAGSAVAVSAAGTGRIRYDETSNEWQKSENGGAWEQLGGTPVITSTYERQASFGVNIGTSTQEATLGRVTFSGSLVGLSVHAEEATTAGTLTANIKINGVTALTAILSSGPNAESNFATASTGTHVLAQDDEVTIEVVGDASYDNTPSSIIGVVVNATLVDGTGSAANPNVATLDSAQVFTAGQAIQQELLPDGAGVVVDGAVSNNFQMLLGQNSDLANPTNVTAGQTINIAVRQDGTGGWTLGFGAAYLFPGGTPTISSGAGEEDLISCYVREDAGGTATVMLCSIAQNHS